MAEHKAPPGDKEMIQELDHTATFWPLGFEEEVAPQPTDEETRVGGNPLEEA